MLYAVPQASADSLELVRMVLQMIASQSDVADSLKIRVYNVISEAREISAGGPGKLVFPTYRESLSLAFEISQTADLAASVDQITSIDMLRPDVANGLLSQIY